MSKSQKRQAVTAAIAVLAECFPQAFVMYEARRKPLKIGVRQDIEATLNGVMTKNELINALRCYCGNRGYLNATRAGATRVGLDGKPAAW
jgi:sRNA-binding protein